MVIHGVLFVGVDLETIYGVIRLLASIWRMFSGWCDCCLYLEIVGVCCWMMDGETRSVGGDEAELAQGVAPSQLTHHSFRSFLD